MIDHFLVVLLQHHVLIVEGAFLMRLLEAGIHLHNLLVLQVSLNKGHTVLELHMHIVRLREIERVR